MTRHCHTIPGDDIIQWRDSPVPMFVVASAAAALACICHWL